MNIEVLKRVDNILMNLLPDHSRNASIMELGYGNPEAWDSLTNFTILTAIEVEFGLIFTFEELTELRNVKDIVKRIEVSNYSV